ncbi:antitoxin [Corynebacterium macginleyi]|uniref:Antitoxin n=1 Tax=Corynebacterium macginleyi TaxID=38290 RepID=A0A3M0GLX9_9CORY|nr:antitoxin [Corynebacterium macginleyi]MBK4140890.1 antitoxin [Corynebacterium macginleyi]MBK4143197.1 antitoxin [Corynebacterium macginleyi]MBK4146768.1 antitoxin [Corynebacterium macginleyi]MBK4157688.1 antitoxin [Corynebacterium macginleyi]MBK4161226.1 antitoxin [Corynebacterium macginleyi]
MGIFDKAKEALNSEKGEEVTKEGLDKAEDFAKDKLGEDKADQVDKARDAIDDKLGTNTDGDDENK